MRIELTLQESQQTADGIGGHSESWVEIATVFGLIEPISARERVRRRPDAGEGDAPRDAALARRRGQRHALHKLGRSFDILTVHDPDEIRPLSGLPGQRRPDCEHRRMRLTMDGLVRALRLDVHDLAEELERHTASDLPRRGEPDVPRNRGRDESAERMTR